MAVTPGTKILPVVTETVVVKVGVFVVRNPMILDMLVVPTSQIPVVT